MVKTLSLDLRTRVQSARARVSIQVAAERLVLLRRERRSLAYAG